MKILKNKVYRYRGRTYVSILYEIEPENDEKWAINDCKNVGEHQARLDKNTWMFNHLHKWVDFDYYATINLLVDSLKHLGKGLIRWDNALHAERNGRRAIYAAHQIDKAYNFETYRDVSYQAHAKRSEWQHKKLKKGYTQLTQDRLKDNAMNMSRDEYERKMFHVIQNRLKDAENKMQRECWRYLHKYILNMWD